MMLVVRGSQKSTQHDLVYDLICICVLVSTCGYLCPSTEHPPLLKKEDILALIAII